MASTRWRSPGEDSSGGRKRVRRGRLPKRSPSSHLAKTLHIEPLEPRCLLSGTAVVLGPQTDWNDQPYVDVEFSYLDSASHSVKLGPYGSAYGDYGFSMYPYNHMLLDTGSNSIMVVSDAAAEMVDNGMLTQGTYDELGVGGDAFVDLSNPLQMAYSATDQNGNVTSYTLPQTAADQRIMFSSDVDLGDTAANGGIPGIVGMPAMVGHVVTLDMSQWSTSMDLFEAPPIGVSITDTLPAGGSNRYSVPIDTRLTFDAGDGMISGDGLPAWAPVSFLTASPEYSGVSHAGTFLLDTGSQMTVISTQLAEEIGLDENHNGIFTDDPSYIDDLEIGGIGGTIFAPEMMIDKLRIPTQQGPNLVWTDTSDPGDPGIDVIVADIAPGIDGVLGVDMLTSGLDYSFDPYTWDIGLTGAPYFDQIHLDLRNLANGSGTMYFDVDPAYNHVVDDSGGGDIGDTTPPTVTGYSLTTDTGASGTDQITSDTTPQLTFTLSEPVELSGAGSGVRVTNSAGNPVTPSSISGWDTDTLTVTFNSPLPDDTYNVTLDGSLITDLSGNPLAGNQANGDELRHFTIDTQPPPDTTPPTLTGYSLATDTGASTTDQITSDATPALTFTFSEPVQLDPAGGGVTVTDSAGEPVTPSAISGSGTDTLTIEFGSLPDDTYSVTLDHSLITDLSGNPLSGNQPGGDDLRQFTIDTQAPAAPGAALSHDTGVSGTDGITSNASLTLTGTEAGALVEYSVNGGGWSTTYSPLERADSVEVRQTDVAGNVGAFTTVTFTLDTTPNVATSVTPSVRVVADSTVAAGFTVTVVYDSTMDRTSPPAIGFTANVAATLASSAGVSGWTGDKTYVAAYIVTDANVTVENIGFQVVAAHDLAGNVQVPYISTGTNRFRIDTQNPAAPGISLANDTGLVSNDKITKDPTLKLVGTETGATIEYSVDGGAWSTVYTPGGNEVNKTVSVRQTDAAGNLGLARAFTFTLDTTPPGKPTINGLLNDTNFGWDSVTSDPTLLLDGLESGTTVVYMFRRTAARRGRCGAAICRGRGRSWLRCINRTPPATPAIRRPRSPIRSTTRPRPSRTSP